MSEKRSENGSQGGFAMRFLDGIERLGNRLPDPAVLFVFTLVATWIASAIWAGTRFVVTTTKGEESREVASQLTGSAMAQFFSDMVATFTGFHPLGVVLVALLGVGVAEAAGLINAAIKKLLAVTPAILLTPMLIFVATLSHTAADAGYVLVIPLGGVLFYAAGRHPLAGIAAAFAGVSGGFSANVSISGIDPLLQGITQAAAGIIDPSRTVNPLCNWAFTGTSCVLIVGIGWYLTDRVIEPRLKGTAIDGDPADMPKVEEITSAEENGLLAALGSFVLLVGLLAAAAWFPSSPLRAPDGSLTHVAAPLMKMIVPLIFLLFLIPGIVHGYVAGTFKSHRDVIKGMAKAMSTMGYYLVMAFFAALFIYAFNKSNLGALVAVKGAEAIKSAGLPLAVTVVGIILLCAAVNLLIGSASAKWALLAPILVPMMMRLGVSPEFTQAAYRVGDSTTNIITPLMPYFPLVVAFCQRYCKKTGIGTVISLMLPYSMVFLASWTIYLIVFWKLGIPLGVNGGYTYP